MLGKKIFWMLLLVSQSLFVYGVDIDKANESLSGKKVFEKYCWGCHHQSAMAFGPSFTEIASKRSAEEIRAMISDPASVSKLFGYKRNAMPSFTLSEEELKAITAYILSYKPKAN